MIKSYLAYVRDNPKGYWFKAKLFGWGWTPVRWQGWAVLVVLVGLIVLNGYRMEQTQAATSAAVTWYVVETAVLVVLLIGICWLKGEPPRWQWGIPKKK